MNFLVNISFDEKKLMKDMSDWIMANLNKTNEPDFFSKAMDVAIESIKSTIKFYISKPRVEVKFENNIEDFIKKQAELLKPQFDEVIDNCKKEICCKLKELNIDIKDNK